jgi:hypothetical protein
LQSSLLCQGCNQHFQVSKFLTEESPYRPDPVLLAKKSPSI